MTRPKERSRALMPASVYYASGVAAAEKEMARKTTWTLEDGRAGFSDRDNFTTNRVTVREWMDSDACTSAAAMGLSATWGCVNLLAGTHGSLSPEVQRSVRGGVDQAEWGHSLFRIVAESPNADQTPLDFWEYCSASVELHGNCYSEIERGTGGRVIALDVPLPPELVRVGRGDGGALEYRVTEGGKQRTIPQDRMFHVRGFGGDPLGGMSTLRWGSRAFGAALSIERAAQQTFRNGVRASGAFVAERDLTKPQMDELEARVTEKYAGAANAGRPLLLNGGFKWQTISISPEDAQMLESRAFSVEEICRFFGVPPHLIGHTQGNTTLGSSIEQQTLHFIIFTLRRRLKRFEQAIGKQLLLPEDRAQGIKVKFNLRDLLRGDSKARQEYYASALRNGWMTINEVRELEGLPPVPGGDVPRIQAQNLPIDQVPGMPNDQGMTNAAT